MINIPKLYEEYHLMNNSDGITKDIMDVIHRYFGARPFRGMIYYAPVTKPLEVVDIPLNLKSIPALKSVMIRFKHYTSLTKWVDAGKYMSAAIGWARPDKDNDLHWDAYIEMTMMVLDLKMGKWQYMIYRTQDIIQVIKHEITHYVQYQFNSSDSKFEDNYNHTLDVKHNKNNDYWTRFISEVLYRLYETEVMAEMNNLAYQLKMLKTNSKNWQEKYKKTIFFRGWDWYKRSYANVLKRSDVDWDKMLATFKEKKVLQGKIVNTNNGQVFKYRLEKHIAKLYERAEKHIMQTINNVIGNYVQKDPSDKTIANQQHNQHPT